MAAPIITGVARRFKVNNVHWFTVRGQNFDAAHATANLQDKVQTGAVWDTAVVDRPHSDSTRLKISCKLLRYTPHKDGDGSLVITITNPSTPPDTSGPIDSTYES